MVAEPTDGLLHDVVPTLRVKRLVTWVEEAINAVDSGECLIHVRTGATETLRRVLDAKHGELGRAGADRGGGLCVHGAENSAPRRRGASVARLSARFACTPYSYRNASMGLRRLARQAG